MARRRRRRRNIGDKVGALLILAAFVWAFAPGVGWDLLDLRTRLGWPPMRSGQALSSLPDSEAARQLRELTIRSPDQSAAVPEYDREAFGQRWADTNHNGCDTRNDILARDLARPTFKPGTHDCVVLSGTLAEPYTGQTIQFERGEKTSSLVQIGDPAGDLSGVITSPKLSACLKYWHVRDAHIHDRGIHARLTKRFQGESQAISQHVSIECGTPRNVVYVPEQRR